MFDKILIANRGEIACRIIRTCREMGIRSAAVFAGIDARAQHVLAADESHALSSQDPVAAYLDAEYLIEVAQRCGAEAIHPGYGFLAENDEFASACEAAGLVFIGPRAETIAKMGSKAAAKACMSAADIPVIPGYHGADQTDHTLANEAKRVGFPLLIKASAGGGGKGMRVVEQEAGFSAALESVRREAQNAFDDQHVILEKYLPTSRHIEVQVFADGHGNVLHLGERECSVQRRHQKIIEESPSPALDASQRAAITSAAINAARSVDYQGAGTVEFMFTDGEFYFLEMNTRLQVEHPVTEAVTGLDLVEWQLRVAAGEALPCKQEEIRFIGHAIEARIYAEDPASGFLPASGELTRVAFPTTGVRVETGVATRDLVSVHFDPMLAKLISHAETRQQAVNRLQQGLRETRVLGVKNNIGFLQRVLCSDIFVAAQVDTGYLDRNQDAAVALPKRIRNAALLMAALKHLHDEDARCAHTPWCMTDGWRLDESAAREFLLNLGNTAYAVTARGYAGRYAIDIEENHFDVAWTRCAGEDYSAGLAERVLHASVVENGESLEIIFDNTRLCLRLINPEAAQSTAVGGPGVLLAPMPATVVAIRIAPGDAVSNGQALVVVEAMKMELVLTAPRDGTVAQVNCAIGDFVQADHVLVELDAEPERSASREKEHG